MTYNYFPSSHGKGEVDGAGILCKCEIRRKKVKPNGLKLQNSHEMVSYLKAQATKYHASHNNAKRTTNNIFWEIKVGGISQSHGDICNIVSCSKNMH